MGNEKLISTSALARKLSLNTRDLFDRLLNAELIIRTGETWELTDKGKSVGGIYKTHPQHGQYIAWPEATIVPEGASCLTATGIGKSFNISPSRINHILSELGWLERSVKGWIITKAGLRVGGIQQEDYRSGVPYVVWHNSILDNQTFKNSIEDAQGLKENSSNSEEFREKFEAKHRATDGHYVRSKAEMLIDNWLYMAEIAHAYERRLPIEEELYCDFYLPVGKLYIEYWGLENDPKYQDRKKQKIEIYERYGFNLVQLQEKEVQNLDDYLPKLLLKFGIQAY